MDRAPPTDARGDCPHLEGPQLAIAAATLALANFMVVLDTTIANVSVPTIAGGLAVSPSEGTWTITSYGVAEAITVPLTGWLAARFGAVRTFVTAMAGFALFSALCGLSQSLGMLVVFRVLQGLSGGPMIPLSQTLLLRIFPKEKGAIALAVWSMTTVTAPIAGPILGGAIAEGAGWPWVFFVNVPVAAVCAIAAWTALKKQETDRVVRPIDYVGLVLLIVWVGALQIMLDKGEEADWFGSRLIVTLACVAAVGFAAFMIWELTARDPIVNLRVFRYRSFSISALTMTLTYGAFFASVVLLPLWLQTNLGYTSTWAGYAVAFNGVLAVVMSPIVAQALMPRVDARALIAVGIGILALSALWRGQFTSDVNFWTIAAPQLLQGAGMPLFFVPLTALALSEMRPDETASGAGLINFVRTTAGSFATSMTTTAWNSAAVSHRSDLVAHATNADPQIVATLDAYARQGASTAGGIFSLDRLIESQAVMLATNQVFLATAFVFVFGVCAIWAAPRPKGPIRAGASH